MEIEVVVDMADTVAEEVAEEEEAVVATTVAHTSATRPATRPMWTWLLLRHCSMSELSTSVSVITILPMRLETSF